MATVESIQSIIDQISGLKDPSIDASKIQHIKAFIETTVNGDDVKESLSISAVLGKDKEGVIVYILTNIRLIKIDINSNTSEMKSSDFFLNKMAIEWKVDIQGTEIKISSQPHSFSLKYPGQRTDITTFFKKVDELRVKTDGSN